jgi:hypothetical protein
VYDRLVLMPGGRQWFVELKSSGGKLSRLQEIFRRQMNSLQFANCVIDTEEKLHEFLTEIGK